MRLLLPILSRCAAITTEITASAFAGVGNPLKDFACVSSILNIASRKAAHTGIIAAMAIMSIVFKLSALISAGHPG